MPDALLATKVSLPILRHLLVPRKKVLRQLSEGMQDGHLLTLVSAPAGYGKTTTIRMWVKEAGHPVAWVTLERSDNDLRQFLTYVLAALGQARENLGQAAMEAVANARQIDLPRVLALLVNDVCGIEQPVILVLEEYQLIENGSIDQVIELILNQAIPNLHLVITTREDPNLPLTRLRVRNQLTEIRASDLSFSLEEAGEFFSHVMGVNLPGKEMEILKNRTEGWVAGLQLAALSLRESGDAAKFVEAFRGTHRHVLDYLIEEVLESQPEEIREFLRRTSILDELSPSLCEAVTGHKASGEHLRTLETNNLFVVSLDEERTWYRYHALFGELLRNQLLHAEPERVDELHERAAAWYQKSGLIRKAVEHAFQISSSREVSELIEKHAIPMLYQGEVSTVMGWFDKLPETIMRSSPMLCIGRAWSLVLMQRQEHAEAVEKALRAAGEALDRTNADTEERNRIAGHAASIQAYLMRSPALAGKKPESLIEISQKAQQLLPADEKGIRSVNALNIGHAYTALADLPAAQRAFEEAFEDGLAGGNFYAAIYGPTNLIVLAMLQGRLRDALRSCEANIDRFNQLLAGQRFPPIGALHVLKGSLLLEQDRLEEAEQELTQGLSLVRWTGEYEAHVRGHAALARLRSLRGDRMGMLESTGNLAEIRPEAAVYAQALRHRLSLLDPAADTTVLEEARRWVMQAYAGYDEVPEITGVDPISRIAFQAHLCAAHVVARLAVRNPQSYPLPEADNTLARLENFANDHGLAGWSIKIWIARALIHQAAGRAKEAQHAIERGLSAAAPRGYFRTFVDEADLMRPLLESVGPRLSEAELSTFVKRLLEAMPGVPTAGRTGPGGKETLSERELEVLSLLAAGQTYKEIGQRLFLSLNTVEFHIKGIYRKLSVNKRVQAIERAREMKLI